MAESCDAVQFVAIDPAASYAAAILSAARGPRS